MVVKVVQQSQPFFKLFGQSVIGIAIPRSTGIMFAFCFEMWIFVRLRWLLIWSYIILKGNLYLRLFYQLNLRVSGRVMSRKNFFHAEISLLSVKRLHSQRKPHVRIRSGKCVDSSEGSLDVIASFTVTFMCFVLHGEWYLLLSSVKKPRQDENFINLSVFSRAYSGAYKWRHDIRWQFSTSEDWKSVAKLFFYEECLDQVLWPQYFWLKRLSSFCFYAA
jgi:hypothetical protein